MTIERTDPRFQTSSPLINWCCNKGVTELCPITHHSPIFAPVLSDRKCTTGRPFPVEYPIQSSPPGSNLVSMVATVQLLYEQESPSAVTQQSGARHNITSKNN